MVPRMVVTCVHDDGIDQRMLAEHLRQSAEDVLEVRLSKECTCLHPGSHDQRHQVEVLILLGADYRRIPPQAADNVKLAGQRFAEAASWQAVTMQVTIVKTTNAQIASTDD